ncbi:MAG: S-layer homology domain-containing protein, partial [Firmicutes bacterium]|nr:S-layer homology domain-containing protein [Bacillota bacterium]
TRAEFAKIAVTAAGSADTATMLEKAASSFKDVKAGAWYTGWINAAEALGLVQGVGNGNYNPNATITNQEVVTVLMRMLGYNDNLPGNWPVNYVTQANKENILDRVAIVAAAPATRGDVVVMLDDALDTEMVTYDKDTNEFVMKQITKGGDQLTEITLLDDSFDGSFVEITGFDRVDDVRDAAKQTLNWEEVKIGEKKETLIIDDKTEVSYNGGSLFSLQGHAGKVYFVEEDDKYYARFIEVESYTKTTSTEPEQDKVGAKVEVGKTKYNVVKDFELGDLTKKNSKYIMYFNEDDQIYNVIADADLAEKSYIVKSVKGSTFKLIGEGKPSTSVTLNDDDVLVYTEDGFIAPSELKAGDAIQEIETDLYVKIDTATGELTKTTDGGKKATIGGTSYVLNDYVKVDTDLEKTDTEISDVYGSEVTYVLNKDNTVAVMILGDDITGTTLYGVITGGSSTSDDDWNAGELSNVKIFTAEGTTVTYAIDEDEKEDVAATLRAANMGKLVEYKLNKDGEIKEAELVDDHRFAAGEIEVKNNKYLVDTQDKSVALASNAVIFEVGVDDGDVDVTLVTRSALLSGGDFTPTKVEGVEIKGDPTDIPAYAVYDTNSTGGIKVLAYTDANGENYLYGVVDGKPFENADSDYNVMLVGDDTVYEYDEDAMVPVDGALIQYTKSGDTIEVKAVFESGDDIEQKIYEVVGVTDGLITFDVNGTEKNYMTDDDTIVYVMNGTTGDYELGSVEDVVDGSFGRVVAMDEDDEYIDCMLIDEYNEYTPAE